jgi:hypothetical protein
VNLMRSKIPDEVFFDTLSELTEYLTYMEDKYGPLASLSEEELELLVKVERPLFLKKYGEDNDNKTD